MQYFYIGLEEISVCWCHVSVLSFSSSSPCNLFSNCCLPNLRELYFGIYRTFCVLSPKAAGQCYCSYFSCHIYIWCSSRFSKYQRKFFSHGEALIDWGFHQTTALVVSKSLLFSTVHLLGGTVKPQVYKVFKVAKQKLLKWLWKMQKQQHINQIFLCSSSSGHWPRFLFWNCLLQCKKKIYSVRVNYVLHF